MKAAQVPKPGGPFQIVEREIPEPRPGQVRLRIEACGVCHSDFFTKEGRWPGIQYPRIPGHEIAGVIDALGDGVQPWKVGQRVGVGWHGGHCGVCRPCRRGIFVACERLQIPGIVYDGGYAEYVITSSQGLAAIPDALKPEEAAPIMCAGITTFNALRHSGAVPGDLVAVQGIGGLGHLGVQFASKMGFETVAIGRGAEKEEMVSKLGAHHYIDAGLEKPADVLLKLGGAKAILDTAPDITSMGALVGGVGVDGTLMVIGATSGPVVWSTGEQLGHLRLVHGGSSCRDDMY